MVSSSDKNNKKKNLAAESLKTKKAREKLLRRFEVIDASITKEALERKTVEIHRWIARHAEHRVALRDKSISLFDEGQNAVNTSERIKKIAQQLQGEDTSR